MPRTPNDIIDQAIRENRVGEWILYAFAVLFVCSGVFALVAGVFYREGTVALAGGIAGALFYPAMREAKLLRRENMAIRLLEAPLTRADTAQKAADALQKYFVSAFGSRHKDPKHERR